MADGILSTESSCAECDTARMVAERSALSTCCPACGAWWLVEGDAAPPDAAPPDAAPQPDTSGDVQSLISAPRALRLWRPGSPARDIPLLARWLPELLARSPALVRGTGSFGHNGSSASAHGGRLDHIDESQGFRRAVEVWRYLRALNAAGRGEAVATLWAAYALAPTCEDPRRQLAAAHEAVSLGAAPRVVREGWRLRAAETDRTRTVRSTLVLPDGFEEVDGRQVPKHREVIRVSTAILSVKGPSFDALAAAWGAERLGPLWAPTPVPPLLARQVATGFVSPETRAKWEGMRTSVRDGAARSWGESWVRTCAESLVPLGNRTEANDRARDA